MAAPDTQLNTDQSGSHRAERARGVLVSMTGRSRSLVNLAGILLIALVGVFDWATGPMVHTELLYLSVVVFVAWSARPMDAAALAVLGAAVSLVAQSQAIFDPGMYGQEIVLSFFMTLLVMEMTVAIVAILRGTMLQLRQQARIDSLTGLLNPRAFEEQAEVERCRALRDGAPITIAFIDLDGFKELNDRYGHASGDEMLAGFARCISESVRPYDVVGRLGGDEFVLLLPGATESDAAGVVSRIKRRVAEADQPHLAASIGLATYLSPPSELRTMIRDADALMYQAKRQGGGIAVGRVVAAPPDAIDIGIGFGIDFTGESHQETAAAPADRKVS